jgi:hypothetical protein
MSKILETYQKSEFAKLGSSNKDKTPLSADDGGNQLHKDDQALAQARGGKLAEKKYSDTIER